MYGDNIKTLIDRTSAIHAILLFLEDPEFRNGSNPSMEVEALKTIRIMLRNYGDMRGHITDSVGPDFYNFTPLQAAINAGNSILVRLMLMEGATEININEYSRDVYFSPENKPTKEGKGSDKVYVTALYLAVMKGELDMVSDLLARGADPSIGKRESFQWNMKDKDLPLYAALVNGHAEISKILARETDAKDFSEGRDTSNTVLHHAAEKGYHEVVKILLEKELSNAFINKVNEAGKTALSIAVEAGHYEVVKILLEKVSDDSVNKVYKDGHTMLHKAVYGGKSLDIIKALADRMTPESINLGDKENFNWSAFNFALREIERDYGYCFDVIECLLKRGAEIQGSQVNSLGVFFSGRWFNKLFESEDVDLEAVKRAKEIVELMSGHVSEKCRAGFEDIKGRVDEKFEGLLVEKFEKMKEAMARQPENEQKAEGAEAEIETLLKLGSASLHIVLERFEDVNDKSCPIQSEPELKPSF